VAAVPNIPPDDEDEEEDEGPLLAALLISAVIGSLPPGMFDRE
jgi:hypothetical protein